MRIAIIAGLMTVGMLAGCGGLDADASVIAAQAQQEGVEALNACTENCRLRLIACSRTSSDLDACNDKYNACIDLCIASGATVHEER